MRDATSNQRMSVPPALDTRTLSMKVRPLFKKLLLMSAQSLLPLMPDIHPSRFVCLLCVSVCACVCV